MTMLRIASALVALCAAACVGPRAPSASRPFAVRLLGASDSGLRSTSREGRRVFTGRAGSDYAVEVNNFTSSAIAISVVIDGLDARTGEPTLSCEGLGGWLMSPEGRSIIRGFAVSDTRIATYRFAPRAQALAAITRGARPEAIGTIEVCFFTPRPSKEPAREPAAPAAFGGIVEKEPGPAEAAVVGELRDEGRRPMSDLEQGALVARVVVAYAGDDAPLGTAPPPAGIARVAPRPRSTPTTEPTTEPTTSDDADATKTTKPTKPTKGTKGPQPIKPTKPTK